MITVQHSKFKTNNVKYNKGFSLIEVLLAAFILSFISLAIFKTLDISILSSNLSNSLVSDADLKIAIHNVLKPEQCNRNLNPSNLDNISVTSKTIDSLKKYKDPTNPSDTSGVELIKINERFRDYLDIVKIELAGPDTDTQREFKVYYKRNRVKHLSTREKKPCDSTDQSGCYVNKCNLEYEVTGTDVTTCTVLDCFSIGSSTVNNVLNGCYSVENDSLILGCGNTQNIGGTETVAIGHFGSSLSVNGTRNYFFGPDIGTHPTQVTGNRNVFMGDHAGHGAVVTSSRNTFIGTLAGNAAQVSNERNSFIGNEAGEYAQVSGRSNDFIGGHSGLRSTVNGEGNTFIGPLSGEEATVDSTHNMFLGFGAGYKSTVTSNYNINIGNTLLMKSTRKQLDSSSYDVPNDEVWINGNLKVCDVNGNSGSCKAVASNSELQASKTKIQTLESTVQNLEMTIQNLQNEINTLKSHTH